MVVIGRATPLEGYRSETEQLNAERTPQAVGLFLVLVLGSGVLEYLYYPQHVRLWLIFYALESLVCLPLLVLRSHFVRRGLLLSVNIVAWCLLSILMHAYAMASDTAPELLAIGVICLVNGTSLLLPWGQTGQGVLAATTVAGFLVSLGFGAPASVAPPYLAFAVVNAGLISVLGARYLDLHRFAIFREATLREREVSISQSLVAIAKDLNGSLDAPDVLGHIAASIAEALGCDWCLIIVRDERRNVFRVVGGNGRVPAALADLHDLEFGAGVFPIIERVLGEGHVEVRDLADADPATASFMRNADCHSLLATPLTRGGDVVGLLVAATQGNREFSQRTGHLFRGIAQHAAIALNNARLVADLRHADRLKSEFLSTMSHELRTPLNVIIGYTDLLLDQAFGPVQEEQFQVLGRLRDNAHSLLELITATLEVNRIEAGRARLVLREVSLRQLVKEIQHEATHLPRQPGVGLSWEAAGQDQILRTDPAKVKIIVKNLVGNALKFTERGRVQARIGYDRRSGELQIQVQDTGSGIPPEDLPHIFGMFRQGEVNNHAGSGVGLGLYIVKRFVEQLGGEIDVTSDPGQGSTFRVALRATAGEDGAAVRRELVA